MNITVTIVRCLCFSLSVLKFYFGECKSAKLYVGHRDTFLSMREELHLQKI